MQLCSSFLEVVFWMDLVLVGDFGWDLVLGGDFGWDFVVFVFPDCSFERFHGFDGMQFLLISTKRHCQQQQQIAQKQQQINNQAPPSPQMSKFSK